jgi:hypothetical protein
LTIIDKLIINRKETMKNYKKLFDDMKDDDELQSAFAQTPVSLLMKYNLITEDDIGQADKRLVIEGGNRVLFFLLSSPEVKEWLLQYQSELRKEMNNNFSLAQLDRKKIYKEVIEGLVSRLDPNLFKSIVDYYRTPGLAPLEVAGSVVYVASDVVAVQEAVVVAVVVTVITALVPGVLLPNLETIDRRDFSSLFDSIASRLYSEADTFRAKADAIAQAKGMPFY